MPWEFRPKPTPDTRTQRALSEDVADKSDETLQTAGALIEGFSRNPLAPPGILGGNAGAAFAVAVGITYLGVTSSAGYVWLVCLGAGTSPGANESAGRIKSTKTRPGNRYLKGALGIAALSAVRSNGTYFSAKYRRIAFRRGPAKALVAVEHAMLTAAWHMLATGELYRDPGADYFTQRTPAKAKARAIGQLESLGYQVTLEPLHQTG